MLLLIPFAIRQGSSFRAALARRRGVRAASYASDAAPGAPWADGTPAGSPTLVSETRPTPARGCRFRGWRHPRCGGAAGLFYVCFAAVLRVPFEGSGTGFSFKKGSSFRSFGVPERRWRRDGRRAERASVMGWSFVGWRSCSASVACLLFACPAREPRSGVEGSKAKGQNALSGYRQWEG
jgi:hypothetical protein